MNTINVNTYCKSDAVGRSLAAATGLLVLSACVVPIDRKDLPGLVRELAASASSACLWVGGRGGAGLVPTGPVVPAGGYGSGELVFGRVNSPGTTLTIKDGECTISRSAAVLGAKVGGVGDFVEATD